MPCKCCLEILNNNLISEFVFISAVLFGTMGQWGLPWELVALAHRRPPPPLLDSPILDMPPLPVPPPVAAVTLPGGPGPPAGDAERQAPTCQGYSLSREVLGSDFVSKFSWFFFFLLLLTPLLQNQSLFMVLWVSSSQDNTHCFSDSSPLDEGNYCSDPEVTLFFPGLIEENVILIYKNCGE